VSAAFFLRQEKKVIFFTPRKAEDFFTPSIFADDKTDE
jgi:hypothetical protein